MCRRRAASACASCPLILYHILPGTLPGVIVYLSLRIGTSILTAAALSFIGLGAQPPSPEWGAMLSDGRSYLGVADHLTLFPGIAIFVTVLAFNLLGDGLARCARSEIALMRARDLGLACGRMPPGARNTIADVPGVTVGHRTSHRRRGMHRRHRHPASWRDIFRDKPVAAAHVLNGFGKSIGLMQMEELGSSRPPSLLTNTFSVGVCGEALIRRAIAANPGIGRSTSTVNPVVCECNDGYLNDIQAMAVDAGRCARRARSGGRGLRARCGGGGRGDELLSDSRAASASSSRVLKLDGTAHHLGVLTLANFGRAGDLVLPDGRRVDPGEIAQVEQGRCIVVVATDVPLDHRQLKRVIRRASAGLARCGSFFANGSGDVFVELSPPPTGCRMSRRRTSSPSARWRKDEAICYSRRPRRPRRKRCSTRWQRPTRRRGAMVMRGWACGTC